MWGVSGFDNVVGMGLKLVFCGWWCGGVAYKGKGRREGL